MNSTTVSLRGVLFFVLAATAISPLQAADSEVSLDPQRKRALDEFIGQFVDLAMFDGTVVIDVAGNIVYQKSFGFAHEEFQVRHRDTTRFRIASVSKTMTDAAFGRMVQSEKVDLETPLARYLPTFPSADKITIRHLLEHSSGIPHTNRQPWGDGSISLTIDEIIERLEKLDLDFEPGSDARYSNGGYAVLAKVLGIIGGSYSEVMRSTVFEPLGMTDTDHIQDSTAVIPRMATGYEPGGRAGERRHPRFYAVESRPGGGSLRSTVPDLLRFARGVFRGDFLTDDLKRDVLGVDEDGLLAQGRSPGFVAKLLFDKKKDMIIVSLANSYAVPADWTRAIADIALGSSMTSGWPAVIPSNEAIGTNDPRLGRYRSSRGGQLVVIEHYAPHGMAMTGTHNSLPTGLVPLTDGSFLMPLYFQRCEGAVETGVITCGILSGDERYTTVLTPIEEGGSPPPDQNQ